MSERAARFKQMLDAFMADGEVNHGAFTRELRGSEMEIENRIAWVLTFRDNRLARVVIYEERADALAAVGLTGAA